MEAMEGRTFQWQRLFTGMICFGCLGVQGSESSLPRHKLPAHLRTCGKMEMLDRILCKLRLANHRVSRLLENTSSYVITPRSLSHSQGHSKVWMQPQPFQWRRKIAGVATGQEQLRNRKTQKNGTNAQD